MKKILLACSIVIILIAPTLAQNNALDFDGSNDAVTILDNNSLDFSTQYTFESWIYLKGYQYSTLISKFDDDGNNRGWMVNFGETGDNTKLCVTQDNTGAWTNPIQWNSGFTPALNTWYHIAVTFDASLASNEIKLYVNGTLYNQTSWAFSITPSVANVYLGGYDNPGNGVNGGANGRFLNGQMDEVRLWNTARSSTEIQNAYNQSLFGSEPGLVAYYPFNQGTANGTNTGLTTLLGLTAPPNNGTLTNFALSGATSNWVSGVTSLIGNNALQFDGNGTTGPFVTVNSNSNDFNLANAFTMEAWINPVNSGNGFYTIFSKGPSNGAIDNSYIFQVQTGTLQFYNAAATAAPYWYNSGITVPYGTWSHVAVTYTNSVLGFYFNGNLVTTFGVAMNPNPGANEFVIGRQGSTGGCVCHKFHGQIDEARIWNVARTPNDIQANLYRTINGNLSGLVAAYNFNQGVGGGNNTGVTTLIDQAGGNHNGDVTLANGFTLNGSLGNWVGSITTVTGLYNFGAPFINLGIAPSVCTNGTGAYTITASGQGSFSYQWYRNGALLAGQTSATLNLTSALTSAAGTYLVQVSSIYGTSTSAGVVFPNCNNALDFDGGNDAINVGNISQLNITQNFTAEAWVYNRTVSAPFVNPVFCKKIGGNTAGWALYINEWNVSNNGKLVLEGSNGSVFISTNTNVVPLNQWSHIAVSIKEGIPNFYVNGIQISVTGSGAIQTLSSTESFSIGTYVGINWQFNGVIDEARIWNISLSQQDIQNNRFKNISTATPGLVGYWDFNQGIPSGVNTGITTVNDKSGNGFNGTLAGFTLSGGASNFISSAQTTIIGTYTYSSPVITGVSPNQTVCSGVTLPLSVTVSGSGLGYQWFKNGVSIAGATASTVTLTSALTTSAGIYTVAINSLGGNITSSGINIGVGCNNALDFDGVDDFLLANHSASLNATNELTIDFWVNRRGNTGVDQSYLDKAVSPNSNVTNYRPLSNNVGNVIFYNGTSASVSSTSYSNNVWTHLAYVINGTDFRVYINGSLSHSGTVGLGATNAGNLYIGRDAFGRNILGTMDELRIWNKALSAADIAQNYNKKSTGNEPGLMAYYNFDQGISGGNNTGITSILDRSPNGNHATTISGFSFLQGSSISNFTASGANVSGTFAFTTPSITGITPSQTVCSGITMPLSITVSGSGLGYQWFKNGISISGATASTVTLTSALTTSAGIYTVAITSLGGNLTSTGINIGVGCNNALNFDGVNDFVRISNPFTAFTNEITVESWIEFDGGNEVFWASQGSVNADNMSTNVWLIEASIGNNTNFYVNNSGTWVNANVTGITNGWHHVAMVANSSALRVFVDGIQVGANTGISGSIQSNGAAQMDIGHDIRLNGVRFGRNRYDNFRVWNIALSQADIQANRFRTITSTVPGLVAAYDFNNGIASGSNAGTTSLIDISSNNRNGVLNNFSLSSGTSNWVASNTTITGSFAFVSPTITGISSSQTVCSGVTLPLSVTVSGSGLGYQWFKNGVSIAGATASTVTLTSALTTSAGIYTVAITSLGGNLTSAGINIGVGCNNALDFDGVDDNILLSSGLPSLSEFTIETWINPRTVRAFVGGFNALMIYDGWNTGYLHYQIGNAQIGLSINGNNPTDANFGSIIPGNKYHLAVSYSVAAKEAKFYVNGVLSYTQTYITAIPLAGGVPFRIGNWNGNDRQFDGQMDEFRVWQKVLSQADIQANMNKTLASSIPGIFLSYDFNQGVANGNNPSTTTVFDRTNNGQNGALTSFALNNTTSNWVSSPFSITGTYGFATPSITGISPNQTVCSGIAIPISVTVSGSGLGYQWFKNGVSIAGATASTVTLTSALTTSAGIYTVAITSLGGNLTSTGINIAVNPNSSITGLSSNYAGCVGNTASISVSGNNISNYQWKKSNVNIPGQTNAVLTFAGLVSESGNYTVAVGNSCNTVTSSNISVNIDNPLSITGISPSFSLCPNQTRSITISGSGGAGQPTFQWYKDGLAIANSNVQNLTITGNAPTVAGNYFVVATAVCGSSTSVGINVDLNCNNALNFNGTTAATQPIPLPALSTASPSFTIEFWVKPGAGLGAFEKYTPVCFNNVGGNAGKFFIQLYDYSGSISPNVDFDIQYYAAGSFSTPGEKLPRNIWSHVAVVANPSNNEMKLYVNGILKSSTTSLTYQPNYTAGAQIKMGEQVPGGEYMLGTIDELRVWQGVRTATDIANNFNATLPSTIPGLLINAPFNEVPSSQFTNLVTGSKYNINASTFDLGVVFAPTPTSITSVSPSLQACPNSNVLLQVNAIGSNLSYQWFKDNSLLAGQTNSTLALSNVGLSNNGNYVSVVTGDVGSATSTGINVSIGCNNALDLDGVNDYVNLGTSAGYDFAGKSFSLEFWSRQKDLTHTLGKYVIGQGISGTNNNALYAGFRQPGIFRFSFYNNDLDYFFTPDSVWHHWAVTYNHVDNKQILYRDGVEVSSRFASSDYLGTGPLLIGASLGQQNFKGQVDQLRVYNRVITNFEVQTRINCEISTTVPGLVANFNFDQGIVSGNNSGNTQLISSFSNANVGSGTLVGFALNETSSNWVASTLLPSGVCEPLSDALVSLVGSNLVDQGSNLYSLEFTSDQLANATTKTITVTNTTNSPIQIKSVTINGLSSDFTIQQTLPSVIGANASANLIVKHNATQFCSDGQIYINTNSYLQNEVIISLRGNTRKVFNLQSNINTLCGDGMVSLTLTGVPTTYSTTLYLSNNGIVENGIGDAFSSTFPIIFNATTAGNTIFKIIGEDQNIGCFDTISTSQNIIVNPFPTVTGFVNPAIICAGQSATFTGSGALTYNWTDGILNNISKILTVSGTVTVTGTDNNGCQNSSSVNVTVNSLPTIAIIKNPTIICQGQSAVLSATGASTYIWDNGDVNSQITVSPTANTNYSVVGTDFNGCKNSAFSTLNVSQAVVLSQVLSSSSIYKASYNSNLVVTGAGVGFSVSSGILPQGISLNTTTGAVSGIPSAVGVYNFGIFANNGSCNDNELFTITVNPALLTVQAIDTTIYQFAALPSVSQYRSSVTGLAAGETLNISYNVNAVNSNVLGLFQIRPIVSGATLGNYILTTIAGSLNIIPRLPLTITAPSFTRQYGDPVPSNLIVTIVGLQSGDNVTANFITETSTTAGLGLYPVTISGISGPQAYKYSIEKSVNGVQNFRTRRLTIRTFDLTIAEGQPFPTTFAGSIIGLIPGGSTPILEYEIESIMGFTDRFTVTPEVSNINLTQYALVILPGTIYVKSGITITGGSFSKVYGQANPPLSGTAIGIKSTDPYVFISYQTIANTNSTVGGYTVYPVITGSDAQKYGFVTIAGTLNITKANLTVAAANLSRDNNDPSPFVFSPVFKGLVNNDNISVNFATNALNTSSIGTYFINPEPSGAALNNYNLSTVAGTLRILSTVDPPVLITITAGNFIRKFGEPEGVYGGNVAGTIASSDNILISYESEANINSPSGIYQLRPVVSGQNVYKYIFTTVAGTLTVQNNIVSVIGLNYERTYGDPNPAFFNTSIVGLKHNENFEVSAVVAQSQFSDVGVYPINPIITGAIPLNYDVVTISGKLSITKAILTVVGRSFTRSYNEPNPPLTYNLIGFRGIDQIQNIDQLPIGETAAIESSPAGISYPIIYSKGFDNNYDFAYTDESIFVNKASQVITIAGTSLKAQVKTGETVIINGNASSGLPIAILIDDETIVSAKGNVVTGLKDGSTKIRIIQIGDNNYLAADTILVDMVSTSTGIVSNFLFQIAGQDTVLMNTSATYSLSDKEGYTYTWKYTGTNAIPNPVLKSNTYSLLFRPEATDGKVIGQVLDSLGNFVKSDSIAVHIIKYSDADVAQNPELQEKITAAALIQQLRPLQCEAVVSDCENAFLKSFSLGKKLNNNSRCSKSGYDDFTSIGKIDSLIMGNSYKMVATSSTKVSGFTYMAVWIDYNNNGSFEDPEDFVRSQFKVDTVFELLNVVIKNDDNYIGPRRVRVSMGTVADVSSCPTEGAAGETEDYLIYIRKEDALEAPDLLTPNDDGKNDLFIVKGLNPKFENRVTILDRWGKTVWDQRSYDNEWGGIDKDTKKLLANGTYYYFVSSGSNSIKGFFEIRSK